MPKNSIEIIGRKIPQIYSAKDKGSHGISLDHPLCVRCRLRGLFAALEDNPQVPVKADIVVPVVRGAPSDISDKLCVSRGAQLYLFGT